MEEGILTEHQGKESELIRQVVDEVVTPRGYKEIKANLDDYDTPSRLSRKSSDGEEAFIPDVTGILNGRKSYFEVAMKTDKIRQVVTKWKLLSNVARFKRGKLVLIVPRGHFAFTNRILNKYPIQADVVKM